jgi:hypothetical protein
MDEVTSEIRADAIISTLIQLRFGRHLGYGEIKPGDDSTTTQSLYVDTLKLAVLLRYNCLDKGHPTISFQVNGFQLTFYMTQKIHQRFYTMTEIGRVKVPDSLSSIESFVSMKNLQTLKLSNASRSSIAFLLDFWSAGFFRKKIKQKL